MLQYAGDLSPTEAWSLLESEASAVLVDVRTVAEWSFVGVPDLSSLNKETVFIEWQRFPDMSRNASFDEQIDSLGADKDAPLLFLCRSGARSASAAALMTANGYSRCYNVAEGFEGDPDAAQHRGSKNGWKVRDLPWQQN